MRVDVSGRQFNFPPQCACCGAHGTTTMTTAASKSTGKKVVHTTTNTWDFPYCHGCVQHVQASANARNMAKMIGIGAGILALYCWFAVGFWLCVLLCIAGGAGATFAYQNLMTQAKSMLTQSCSHIDSSVAFLGWSGSCNTFEIISPQYALAFMIANEKKLVNLSPQAAQMLQSSGHGNQPNRAQGARRYTS